MMMTTKTIINIDAGFEQAKHKVLNYANGFGTFCFLDNHQYQLSHHTEECLLAAGIKKEFNSLNEIAKNTNSWLFGHLGYDLKNQIENLTSDHPDHIGFPDCYFFEPEVIVRLNRKEMIIEAEDADPVREKIFQENNFDPPAPRKGVKTTARFSKEDYIETIKKLKQHILRGDCYEINFCQEFFAEQVQIDPVEIYKQLSKVSPNPFSALYKMNDKWLICASPERFLRKEDNKILSQPIKGTSGRIPANDKKDELSKKALYESAKDRSENVMVVDLVRNDLARICEEGTVKVDELFGVYSFPQVHQMISTVSGELGAGIDFTDMIRACFPMGSMTGAPKKRVMELIEKYERTKRGIFSGAVGYINPTGNFDFNVVIRSILYNAATQYLSYQVGSGITFYSEPGKEWEECLLKASAIEAVLST